MENEKVKKQNEPENPQQISDEELVLHTPGGEMPDVTKKAPEQPASQQPDQEGKPKKAA